MDELKRFSSFTPKETVIELQYLRWAPWFKKRQVRLDSLRRLDSGWRNGNANLEHLPEMESERVKNFKQSIVGEFIRKAFGLFIVNRKQDRDKSAVPGVWDGIWEQIPYEGEASIERRKLPPTMRGRGTMEVRSKPPPPHAVQTKSRE